MNLDLKFLLIVQDESELVPIMLSRVLDEFRENIVGVMIISPFKHLPHPLRIIRHAFNLLGPVEFVRTAFKQIFSSESVKSICLKNNCNITRYIYPNSPKFREIIRKYEVDILISLACPIILCRETIEAPNLCSINVHGSYLPDFRGVSTVFWAMLKGADRTGATVHKMTTKVDSGDYFYRESIPITQESTLFGLYKNVADKGGELLVRTLHDACNDKMKAYPIPHGGQYVSFPQWADGFEFRRKGLKYR